MAAQMSFVTPSLIKFGDGGDAGSRKSTCKGVNVRVV